LQLPNFNSIEAKQSIARGLYYCEAATGRNTADVHELTHHTQPLKHCMRQVVHLRLRTKLQVIKYKFDYIGSFSEAFIHLL